MKLPDWHYPLYTAARGVADKLLSIECALLNGHEDQAEQCRKTLPTRADRLRIALLKYGGDLMETMPVSGWISVKDALPELGERVLVSNGIFVCESYLDSHGHWRRGKAGMCFMTPTHWMPLPEPPKEENYEVEMQVHDRV